MSRFAVSGRSVVVVPGVTLAVGPFRARAGLSPRLPGLHEKAQELAAAVAAQSADGSVLLLKRGATAPWMPGRWNLPGGVADHGEPLEETARRETAEETGLRVGELRKLLTVVEPESRTVFFHTTDFEGEVQTDWESAEARWVPVGEARSYDLVPGVVEALDRIGG